MEPTKTTEQAISEIQHFQEKLHDQKPDIDPELLDPDDKDPHVLLYEQITDHCIEVLQMPTIAEAMNAIGDKLGDDVATNLCTVMAIIMTNAAFNAITFYDGILKEELNPIFKDYNTLINDISGTVKGHDGALEVFKQRLANVQKKLGLDNSANQ